MVREIGHTILNDKYVDIDINNCYPVILLWLCDNLKIKATNLRKYINEREDIIKSLIKLNPDKCREFLKNCFLSINNGGGKKLIIL